MAGSCQSRGLLPVVLSLEEDSLRACSSAPFAALAPMSDAASCLQTCKCVAGIGGGFMFGILQDYLNGRMQINQVRCGRLLCTL